MRDIRKYEVFQLADQLVLEVYRVTVKFPKSEIFGLTGQTRRAPASIPMNLVECAAAGSLTIFHLSLECCRSGS
jgi:four helix bundle protein